MRASSLKAKWAAALPSITTVICSLIAIVPTGCASLHGDVVLLLSTRPLVKFPALELKNNNPKPQQSNAKHCFICVCFSTHSFLILPSPFVRSLIGVFDEHPPLRSKLPSVTSSASTASRHPLPLVPAQHPGSSYPPGPGHHHPAAATPSIPVPMMLSHMSMRVAVQPSFPAPPAPPPPPSAWEQRVDPHSGRPCVW